MNDVHQMPPDTAFLMSRVNENTSDHMTVETGSAKNVFTQQGYENPSLRKLCGDDLRRKALLNLGDYFRRIIL